MYENNTTPAEQGTAGTTEPTVEEVLAEDIRSLQHQLVRAEQARDFHQELHFKFAGIIDKARKSIEEVLAGDTDAETTYEEFREAFELLGVQATRVVDIEVSLTWRGTIELPLGVEVSDLDIDDFNIREPEHQDYETRLGDYGLQDYSIEER